MNRILIDTHILIWILFSPRDLKKAPWIRRFNSFVVSPFSLLEMKFLMEGKRIRATDKGLFEAIENDARFLVDEVSLIRLCETARSISWTRDPFDRLLVAHSELRGYPFGTCDEWIQQNFQNTVE